MAYTLADQTLIPNLGNFNALGTTWTQFLLPHWVTAVRVHVSAAAYYGYAKMGRQEEVQITVDTAVNSTTYTISVAGETITYTSDGSATKPEITAGLKAAVEANATANAAYTVTDDTVDTITLLARTTATGTVSETDANLSTTTLSPGLISPTDGGSLSTGDPRGKLDAVGWFTIDWSEAVNPGAKVKQPKQLFFAAQSGTVDVIIETIGIRQVR